MRGDTKTGAIGAHFAVSRIVKTRQINELLKLATRRFAQGLHHAQVVLSVHMNGHLTQSDGNVLNPVTQGRSQGVLQVFGANGEIGHRHSLQARAMVCVRRIFCCSWMMP